MKVRTVGRFARYLRRNYCWNYAESVDDACELYVRQRGIYPRGGAWLHHCTDDGKRRVYAAMGAYGRAPR